MATQALVMQVGTIILQDASVQAQIASMALQGLQGLQSIAIFIAPLVKAALIIIGVILIAVILIELIDAVAQWFFRKFKPD